MDIYQILRVKTTVDKNELQAKYSRLLDTYKLTVAFAEDKAIVDVANKKMSQLIEAGKECGLSSDESVEMKAYSSIESEISLIKLALNSSKADGALLRKEKILERIIKLPDCAEKHYLKAIVDLKYDSSLKGCKSAIDDLKESLKFDPTNTAVITLMDAINEQLNEYANKLQQKQIQDENDRLERERQSQEALSNARRRQLWDGISPCCAGLGGLAMSILGCVCFCKCCDSVLC